MKSGTRGRSVTAVAFGYALLFAASAGAGDALPKSGSFKTHNSNQPENRVAQVGESHVLGSGTLWGVHFNDAGDGLLHLATLFCAYTFDRENGSQVGDGRCVSTDSDGDQIFRTFKGKADDKAGTQGMMVIIGGTGKFAGIQGDSTYQCKFVHSAPALGACEEQWNYRLP